MHIELFILVLCFPVNISGIYIDMHSLIPNIAPLYLLSCIYLFFSVLLWLDNFHDFLKELAVISLIFSCCPNLILFIFVFIFIIFFFLPTFVYFPLLSNFFKVDIRFQIFLLFSNMSIQCYKFISKHCFICVSKILTCA